MYQVLKIKSTQYSNINIQKIKKTKNENETRRGTRHELGHDMETSSHLYKTAVII